MSLPPKAPPVFKPAQPRLPAPPVYRPNQVNAPIAQLKSANNFRLETRPAPQPAMIQPRAASAQQVHSQPRVAHHGGFPIVPHISTYISKQDATSARLKTANNFRLETRPAPPVCTTPQAMPGRVFGPPPVYRGPAAAVAQGKGSIPAYRPVAQPVHNPDLSNVVQGRTLTAKNSMFGPVSPMGSPSGADSGPVAQPPALSFPADSTVQAVARNPKRKAAFAGQAARRKAIGLNAIGRPIRKKWRVDRFDPSPEGKYGRIRFKFMGQTRWGLNPGNRFLNKVNITYTGSRAGDYAAAGGAPGAGQVWHHYHNYNPATNRGTMYLMTVADHAAAHSGGVWMYEQANGVVYG